jgi:hypothetical protein
LVQHGDGERHSTWYSMAMESDTALGTAWRWRAPQHLVVRVARHSTWHCMRSYTALGTVFTTTQDLVLQYPPLLLSHRTGVYMPAILPSTVDWQSSGKLSRVLQKPVIQPAPKRPSVRSAPYPAVVKKHHKME